MKFKAFLLDQWLRQHADAEINLGAARAPAGLFASCSTRWRQRPCGAAPVRPRAALPANRRRADPAGSHRRNQGVPAEEVAVFTGGAEALIHIFSAVAEPGANVVIPFPCFPPTRRCPRRWDLKSAGITSAARISIPLISTK